MERLFIHCFQIKFEFRTVSFCGGRKTREPGEKHSEQGENQQTQRTYDTVSRIRTQVTLVGDRGYHRCTNPTSLTQNIYITSKVAHQVGNFL